MKRATATLTWFKQWALLLIIASALAVFFISGSYRYLTLPSLQHYHHFLKVWTEQHYFSAAIIYTALFTALIACGIPVATLLGLLGGFLFGHVGVIYAALGTTLGGIILYSAVKYSFAATIEKRQTQWLKKFEAGFKTHAFRYLLSLRLIPVLPCWVSNIAAGLFNVNFFAFATATLLGILPSTYIYVLTGRSLNILLLDKNFSTANLLLKPSISIPILLLIFMTLAPMLWKFLRKNTPGSKARKFL